MVSDSVSEKLFLDLSPLRSLEEFHFYPEEIDNNLKLMSREIQLVLPDKVKTLFLDTDKYTNLNIRRFPSSLEDFSFVSEGGQKSKLPKLSTRLKILVLTHDYYQIFPYDNRDLIPKWIGDQKELNLDYFLLSSNGYANEFVDIPKTKVFHNINMGIPGIEYVTLTENTFSAPEYIKELKGEIYIDSRGILCLKKFPVLEVMSCLLNIDENEYQSFFEAIKQIKDITLTIQKNPADKEVHKCIEICKKVTGLELTLIKTEPMFILQNMFKID